MVKKVVVHPKVVQKHVEIKSKIAVKKTAIKERIRETHQEERKAKAMLDETDSEV
jgi:hypothetical protein